jgi:hypothetical protein
MVSRAIMLVATVVLTVIVMMVALIIWAAHAPHSNRSGTVLAKRAYPETTELVPMYDTALHMMTTHTVVSGPDWALTVRRPGGQTLKVWVRRTVYEQCAWATGTTAPGESAGHKTSETARTQGGAPLGALTWISAAGRRRL